MTQSTHIHATIVQLLSNMSGTKEVRTYLQRFAGAGDRFAVIKIGGAIIDEQLEETAAALACLHQVGLTPVVIHGGGPQLDAEMAAAGLQADKVDGLRVTGPEVLDLARKVFLAQNLKLVEAVRAQGVEAHTLSSGVIEAALIDPVRYGFVGRATGVQDTLIRSVIASGAMPILTCLGIAPGGQVVNINGDAVVAALVHALQPLKIVFLSGTGGLLDEAGDIIDVINLTTDYDELLAADWVQGGMRLKLQEIASLLADLPPDSSISITKPTALIRELFTHGGAGTLIRRGERLVSHDSRDSIDAARLADLVEAGFGRPLQAGWWDGVAFHRAIISEEYRAAALVTRLPGIDVPYLDKFAVVEAARGEGLAKALWQRLCAEVPVFFLRSRNANSFNDFYHGQADGCVKRGPWTVFWNGEVSLAEAAPSIEAIASLPESFAG